MVDVLLTILIFFMTITSAQVLRVDKSIVLPVAPNAQKKDNSKSEAIVNVRWKPETKTVEYVFDDKVYAKPEELIPILKPRHDADVKYPRRHPRRPRSARAGDLARDERLRRIRHLGYFVFDGQPGVTRFLPCVSNKPPVRTATSAFRSRR